MRSDDLTPCNSKAFALASCRWPATWLSSVRGCTSGDSTPTMSYSRLHCDGTLELVERRFRGLVARHVFRQPQLVNAALAQLSQAQAVLSLGRDCELDFGSPWARGRRRARKPYNASRPRARGLTRGQSSRANRADRSAGNRVAPCERPAAAVENGVFGSGTRRTGDRRKNEKVLPSGAGSDLRRYLGSTMSFQDTILRTSDSPCYADRVCACCTVLAV
jgi:hypothetical protein